MKLANILTPTRVATPGMLVRDVFAECVRAQVPAIPYRDASGELVGRISIRNTLKCGCLPDFMIEMANVLGNDMTCVGEPDGKARELLCHAVDDYVLPKLFTLNIDATVFRALAIMEKHDSSYVFMTDGGDYKGVVTSLGIARRMVELDMECMP